MDVTTMELDNSSEKQHFTDYRAALLPETATHSADCAVFMMRDLSDAWPVRQEAETATHIFRYLNMMERERITPCLQWFAFLLLSSISSFCE